MTLLMVSLTGIVIVMVALFVARMQLAQQTGTEFSAVITATVKQAAAIFIIIFAVIVFFKGWGVVSNILLHQLRPD
jgi:hypothetical protein